MSNSSQAVKNWRKNTKKRLLLAMGNECVVCGYSKCENALEFHHLYPEEKSFGLGSVKATPKKWISLVEEVKKCVILCSNCHKEYHAGLIQIPKEIPQFNKDLENYIELKKEEKYDKCPICNNKKLKRLTTCSQKCAKKKISKLNWDEIDLEELYKKNSILGIGKILGVSDNAVRKHLKKRGLLANKPR